MAYLSSFTKRDGDEHGLSRDRDARRELIAIKAILNVTLSRPIIVFLRKYTMTS